MPRSSKRSLLFRCSNQYIICISYLSHVCYMSRSSYSPWFHHPNNIWWSVQVTKLLITQCSPASRRLAMYPDIICLRMYKRSLWICIPIWSWHSYMGASKCFRTDRLERELQMVQLSATRCSCIAILWVSLVIFAAITLCVASQWSVYCCKRIFRYRLSTETFGYTLVYFRYKCFFVSFVLLIHYQMLVHKWPLEFRNVK
jgi:hypothetical protein